MPNLAWSPQNYDDDDIDRVIGGVGSGLLWKQKGNMVQVHSEGTTDYATGSFKDFQLYESGIITPWVMTGVPVNKWLGSLQRLELLLEKLAIREVSRLVVLSDDESETVEEYAPSEALSDSDSDEEIVNPRKNQIMTRSQTRGNSTTRGLNVGSTLRFKLVMWEENNSLSCLL
ncbi:hypothetical protein Tco_1562974 [Tanacetum coccineum]